MEGFHIYEEVGGGAHSLIYKGREKETVKYVAIKSVDKKKLEKVLHEVRILYRLSHPNVLKFHRWYETRHHIWLILEYCSGGSLKELLAYDKRLPENAVRIFGTDLLHALHYLHTSKVIFCDLKPSNILLNEYGVLKLSDFALAANVDQIKTLKSGKKRSKVRRTGTPYYMAPELFGEEGVHSYASDMWSLGCVLYEMAMGHLPFFSNNFTELVHKIQNDPLELPLGDSSGDTHEQGDASAKPQLSVLLKNLLRSLLRKDPAKRISWPALLTHEFWGSMPMPKLVPLPANPTYANYLQTRTYVPSCKAEDSDQEFDDVESLDENLASPSEMSKSSPYSAKPGRGQKGAVTNQLGHAERHQQAAFSPTPDVDRDLVLENPDTVLNFGYWSPVEQGGDDNAGTAETLLRSSYFGNSPEDSNNEGEDNRAVSHGKAESSDEDEIDLSSTAHTVLKRASTT
jgi:serine/threonine protein kinase